MSVIPADLATNISSIYFMGDELLRISVHLIQFFGFIATEPHEMQYSPTAGQKNGRFTGPMRGRITLSFDRGAMPLPQVLRDRILMVAKHEFGHWLMAARLGFTPSDIEITITHKGQGHRGGASITLQDEIKSIDDVRSYTRRRIGVLFAGSFAESLSPLGEVNPQYAVQQLEGEQGGAKDDFSKIRELLRILRSIEYRPPSSEAEHENQLRTLQTPIWDRSGEIIQQDHAIVLGMAPAIAARAKAIDVPFGMKEQEIRGLPSIRDWLEVVAGDRYWLNFP
jgi:hypothetical protein